MSATQTVLYHERVEFAGAAAGARIGQFSREAIRVCGFASAGDAVDVSDDAAPRERDDVDEDSIQSFPASDPPGWISMWLGAPTSAEQSEEAVCTGIQ